MADMLTDWVSYLEKANELREAMAGISAARINRLLGAFKLIAGRRSTRWLIATEIWEANGAHLSFPDAKCRLNYLN